MSRVVPVSGAGRLRAASFALTTRRPTKAAYLLVRPTSCEPLEPVTSSIGPLTPSSPSSTTSHILISSGFSPIGPAFLRLERASVFIL